MSKTLLVVSAGPVQSFIAAGRKAEDLWSGSYLLSYLIEKAVSHLMRQGKAEMIYPAVTLESLDRHSDLNVDIASLPNRFVALIDGSAEETRSLVSQVEEVIYSELERLVQFAIRRVFPGGIDLAYVHELADRQVKDMLEFFWAMEPLQPEEDVSFEQARSRLEQRLAAIKNNRMLPAHHQSGLICTLCGERDALHDAPFRDDDTQKSMRARMRRMWGERHEDFRSYTGAEGDKGRIDDGEFLCAICLGKRVSREYFQKELQTKGHFQRFQSTVEVAGRHSYYAILLMDGDEMGKWFSGEKTFADASAPLDPIGHYREISRRLGRFAKEQVPALVREHGGQLIYAGGDDVLAYVPVAQVFDLAQQLRQAFGNAETGLGQAASASMGIVIAHAKDPLHAVLDQVRELEKNAKAYVSPVPPYPAKNAFSLAYLARSGELRKVTLPWVIRDVSGEMWTMTELKHLMNLVTHESSATFIYAFAQSFLPLLGNETASGKQTKLFAETDTGRLPDQMLRSELQRLLTRSNRGSHENVQTLASLLVKLHHALPSTFQFIQLLQIVRNMGRKIYGSAHS